VTPTQEAITAFVLAVGFAGFVIVVGGRANPNGIAGPRTRVPLFVGAIIVCGVAAFAWVWTH
jgi:hypothetical protein